MACAKKGLAHETRDRYAVTICKGDKFQCCTHYLMGLCIVKLWVGDDIQGTFRQPFLNLLSE